MDGFRWGPPVPYIVEIRNAVEFYTNKILKAKISEHHLTWAKDLLMCCTVLADWVKKWHKTGVTYNPKGEANIVEHLEKSDLNTANAAPVVSGNPPPPPPPPAAPLLSSTKASCVHGWCICRYQW